MDNFPFKKYPIEGRCLADVIPGWRASVIGKRDISDVSLLGISFRLISADTNTRKTRQAVYPDLLIPISPRTASWSSLALKASGADEEDTNRQTPIWLQTILFNVCGTKLLTFSWTLIVSIVGNMH